MRPSERAGLAPALALLVNALVWGISWWPFRELHRLGLHPLWATALVYAVSIALLLIAQPRAWAGFGREPRLWLLLVAAGLTNVGFNWGVTVGDVVRVVLLFYLMPAWSVILAWPLLGEKPTPAGVLRLLVAMGGVLTVLKTPTTPWPVPDSVADWLALAGGFSFALTNITLRRLAHVDAPQRIFPMFAGGALMAALAAFAGLAMGVVPPVPAPQVEWTVLGLALSLGFLASNVALQFGASRLPAHATALIMLSEIVFASASSVTLGAATLSSRVVTGGALILFAAAWSAWDARQSAHEGAQ